MSDLVGVNELSISEDGIEALALQIRMQMGNFDDRGSAWRTDPSRREIYREISQSLYQIRRNLERPPFILELPPDIVGRLRYHQNNYQYLPTPELGEFLAMIKETEAFLELVSRYRFLSLSLQRQILARIERLNYLLHRSAAGFLDIEAIRDRRRLPIVLHIEGIRSERRIVELPQRNPVRKVSDVVLLFGNPDLSNDRKFCWDPLPNSANEIESVSSHFPTKVRLEGRKATLPRVYRALKAHQANANYIYFATHGLSNSVDPADKSFLALRNGLLSAASLRKLKFKRSPLVVLSACQTGLGKTFPGGLFGLAQAWYHAGAKKTVMSLWNISDSGTALLMGHFNNELKGLSSSRILVEDAEVALAKAMRLTKKSVPDPSIWASMAVYGRPI